MPPRITPEAPIQFTVVSKTTEQITLSWQHDGNNLTSFEIIRSLSGLNNFVVIERIDKFSRTFTDTNLSANTRYDYKVIARNTRLKSQSNVLTVTTQAIPAPNPVYNLQAQANSYSSMGLSWSHDNQHLTGFVVERKKSLEIQYTTIARLSSLARHYSDSGLSENTQYNYRITAVNSSILAEAISIAATTPQYIPSNALRAYTGSWTANEASHLLKRAMFGPSQQQIEKSLQIGLSATLDELFTERDEPAPPLKYQADGSYGDSQSLYDPDVNQGETWIDAPPFPNSELVPDHMERNRVIRARSKSLNAWSFHLMYNEPLSITEKMVVFWHNHFVVSDFTFAQRAYLYSQSIRTHALGNFRELTKVMTIDTGMLLWLNGAQSSKESPNENYPREMLELFTVGKGLLAAPGDYSTFTEQDVTEMSKVLTGWRVPSYSDAVLNGDTFKCYFDASKHDSGQKYLSHHFNHAVINNNNEHEYKDLIDVVFTNPACSVNIARELYRWFVHYDINEEVEQNVILPLSQIIRDNDYEISLALRILLSSEHFFNRIGCMIKSPIDLMMSLTRGFDIKLPEDLEDKYEYGVMLHKTSAELGMGLFNHPHVGGWTAWYQSPQYYRFWLNNLTYPKRNEYAVNFVYGGTQVTDSESFRVKSLIPILAMIKNMQIGDDVNAIVSSITNIAFCHPVSEEQHAYLSSFLIPEGDQTTWLDLWQAYLEDPENRRRYTPVKERLQNLFAAIVQMPEFQLM